MTQGSKNCRGITSRHKTNEATEGNKGTELRPRFTGTDWYQCTKAQQGNQSSSTVPVLNPSPNKKKSVQLQEKCRLNRATLKPSHKSKIQASQTQREEAPPQHRAHTAEKDKKGRRLPDSTRDSKRASWG
jgi:hypothetical protein